MERLYRSRRERIIGGVCGGIAEYMHIDPTLIRVGWVVAALIWGAGILVYLICWLVIPEAPWGYQSQPRPGREGKSTWSDLGGWSKAEDRPFGGEGGEGGSGGEGGQAEPASQPSRLATLAGIFCIGLGILALLPIVVPLPIFTWSRLWPVLVIGLGILLIASGARER